jgi:(1->4)-alpha-D-glucan 1-alpha-D-glucosylmutase
VVFEAMKAPKIPVAMYRLQFNKEFTFLQAADLVPYLASLGISHCYASPYLRARPGSLHGYDIIDHHHLNPEIGSPEAYEHFLAALHQHGMGQILDVVPNHMGIMGSDNAWWLDVLENGQASTYADYFDIDWQPLKDELHGKVLVPVLGDQYGWVLDRGELKLTFDCTKGELSIFYFQHRFPIDPRGYQRILSFGIESLEQELGSSDEDYLELQSLISAFGHLPSREEISPEARAERVRDKEIHKHRLLALCERSASVSNFIERTVAKLNGKPGDSHSFDELHELIKAQAYRLAFWRVAADDINYRRFFDINDLAALCQDKQDVFDQTHQFVFELLREGKIDGLRVDHPDGLYNPRQYFERLQQRQAAGANDSHEKPYYVVAEKILTGNELLADDWPIYGTTGYNFANLVNGLFVDPADEKKMDRIYRIFVGRSADFSKQLYECKKRVMDRWLNSELNVLASALTRIALADRHTCDFTLKTLRDALTDVLSYFPVYRTYVTEEEISLTDRKYIELAVNRAKAKSTAADSTVLDFIHDVLLTSQAENRPLFYQRAVIHFAMRFQQYTSALMAKGLEDTCFYRYNRLISLNDVGGDPLRFGVTPDEFHREILARARIWPHEMVTTSTHDSKRSEDVRVRINVLSEMPLAWHRHVRTWRNLNRDKKTPCNGTESLTPNDEYLLYQTLIGAWPFQTVNEKPPQEFAERIRHYMLKAIREAKDRTSWTTPNETYESAVANFVGALLESEQFLETFLPFQRKVAFFGMLSSLAQTLIKLTVPGVPDIYQGNELWTFNLVDPDNRRRVDYVIRKDLFQGIRDFCRAAGEPVGACSRQLLQNMEDGRIKMYVIWKTLELRNRNAQLFREGKYVALESSGEHAKHVVAFARKYGRDSIIVAVPRLTAKLLKSQEQPPCSADVWKDTRLQLPGTAATQWRNVFTGALLRTELEDKATALSAKGLFSDFPVALLNYEPD